MTTTPFQDHTILHQTEVELVIDERIELENVADRAEFAKQGTAVIASPTAPSATYVQAEAQSMKTAIDAIRAALTAADITA